MTACVGDFAHRQRELLRLDRPAHRADVLAQAELVDHQVGHALEGVPGDCDAGGLQAAPHTGGRDVAGQFFPPGRVVDVRSDHPEWATDALQGGGHLRDARHARVDHDQVEIGVFRQVADLLGIPYQHRGGGVQEAARRHDTLGVSHLDRHDQVHAGRVEHLRGGLGLVFLFHQRRADRFGVFCHDCANPVGGFLGHRAHVRSLVVIIFQERHHQHSHLRFCSHRYPLLIKHDEVWTGYPKLEIAAQAAIQVAIAPVSFLV